MNIITRILGVLVVALLVAFLTVLLITPQTVADVIARLEQIVTPVRIALVVLMYLLVFIYFYLRLRFAPQENSDMLRVNTSGAIAAVTVDSVQERILKAVSDVPGVASVAAQLKSVGGRADIDLNVTTADDQVNVPEKQKEISRALEQVVKKQLGLQMAGRPRINIRLGSDAKPPMVVEPPPADSAVDVPEPVIITPPPPPITVDEPETEETEEPRGLFGRFGFGQPEQSETTSVDESVPAVSDIDDADDSAVLLDELKSEETPLEIEDSVVDVEETDDEDRIT